MEDFLIAYANFFYLGAVGTERFRVLKNPTAETQIERNRKRWGNRKSVCGRAVNSLVSPMTRPQRFPVPDLRGKWRRARSADGRPTIASLPSVGGQMSPQVKGAHDGYAFQDL